MVANAIRRFKFQELQIANNLRQYLARAADGNNKQFGIENNSDITEIEMTNFKLE